MRITESRNSNINKILHNSDFSALYQYLAFVWMIDNYKMPILIQIWCNEFSISDSKTTFYISQIWYYCHTFLKIWTLEKCIDTCAKFASVISLDIVVTCWIYQAVIASVYMTPRSNPLKSGGIERINYQKTEWMWDRGVVTIITAIALRGVHDVVLVREWIEFLLLSVNSSNYTVHWIDFMVIVIYYNFSCYARGG